ncbi:MAG: AraC family transcriptional regulator [Candidatus Acidiferrales bacterium]
MAIQFPKGFVHGELARARRVSGLLLAEVNYRPLQQVAVHAHDHARFVLVLRGSFAETFGRGPRTVTPSTLIFRPPEQVHAQAFHERGARLLVMDLAPAWMERAREEAPVLNEAAEFRGGLLLHLAHRLHDEFNRRDEVSKLAMEGILLGMVAEASRRLEPRAAQRRPRWLDQVCDLLHARFAERLTMDEIARAVGVHPVHLARSFRHFHHCTLGEYVRGLRIEFACRQIAFSELPLSEVALVGGFSDQSHFSRIFKRHTGMTPAEYRQLARSR